MDDQVVAALLGGFSVGFLIGWFLYMYCALKGLVPTKKEDFEKEDF